MTLAQVKQQMFALRNGLLADGLRRNSGGVYTMVFGLMLPQIKEIAAMCGKDQPLALQLWANANCRESRLLAPYVAETMPEHWPWEVQTEEEADVLCHALLRHLPQAPLTADALQASPTPLHQYTARRLRSFLKNSCGATH